MLIVHHHHVGVFWLRVRHAYVSVELARHGALRIVQLLLVIQRVSTVVRVILEHALVATRDVTILILMLKRILKTDVRASLSRLRTRLPLAAHGVRALSRSRRMKTSILLHANEAASHLILIVRREIGAVIRHEGHRLPITSCVHCFMAE
jgi:hypothetical protein